MKSLSCVRIAHLLVKAIGEQASETERLELELHLEGCAACRSDKDVLDVLPRLRRWEPTLLSADARERVAQAALRASVAPAAAAPRRWSLALAATAVAVAGCVVVLTLAASGSHVLAGDVAVTGSGWRGISDGARLESERGGRVSLGGPVLDLGVKTRLVWRERERTVELQQGSVFVDVDPRQGKPFRVATPGFAVEVLGTRFRVEMAGVRTERGKVRVVAPDGTVWAVVGAGEEWSLASRAAVDDSPAAVPAAVAPETPPALEAPPPPEGPPAGLTLHQERERLRRAREKLAEKDAAGARALLEPFSRSRRTVQAEAEMVRADSYLVERRYEVALARYRAVWRDFRETPQAEIALYSAAQLQVEHGSRDEAMEALRTYLAHYPRGRFADDVADRLTSLAGGEK